MNLPQDRCEEALVAIISPALTTLGAIFDGVEATAVTSKESTDRELPIVICAASGNSTEEEPKGSGNFWLDVQISIKHRALDNPSGEAPTDDAKDLDQQLVSAVRDVVSVNDLDAQLSAAVADFTVIPGSVIFNSPDSGQDDQGVWVDQINLRLLCCGSTIPA